MVDANQGTGGQGQEPGTTPAGQGQEPGQQSGQQGQGQEPGQDSGNGPADVSKMSEAELRTYAERLQRDAGLARTEAANYRTQFQTVQGKLTEAERAKLSNEERVQADLTAAQSRAQELETQVRDLTTGAAVREALGGAGALNPITAAKVMDQAVLELGSDGKPTAKSLTSAIAALKTSDPYLFRRTANADAGQGRGGSPESGLSVNDFIRGGRR